MPDMRTIITKHFDATRTRRARIKVVCWEGAINVTGRYKAFDQFESHKNAANEMVRKLNAELDGTWKPLRWRIVSWGTTPTEDGYVFLIELVNKNDDQ